MTLISRFFKPEALLPPTLAERIAALEGATPEAVEGTALGTEEDGLRAAAIARLPEGPALRALAGLEPAGTPAVACSQALRHAAQARLAGWIDAGRVDAAAFLGEAGNRLERLAIVGLCADPEHLVRAIGAISDPAQLARIAADSASSRARQLAATALEDPAELRALLKQLRGKDKTVYRIVKQKCDALAAETRKVEDAARDAAAVCAALERHVTALHDVVYAPTLEHLRSRWRAFDPRPGADLEQRAATAIERCQGVIDAHEQELARQAAERAAADAAREAAHAAREQERVAALEAAAERAAAESQASADAAVAALAAAANRGVEAEKHDAAEQALRQVGSLIRLARDVLRAGNTRKAASFRLAVEEKLQAAPPLPPHLARLLQQLDDQLNELKHWKDYAVAPKRIELIEEMEALVGVEDEPAALAERIRALQQEWRTINKGIVSGTPEELARFQRAQQAAFKPCQDYFAAQARIRQENLEARRSVVGRLLALEAAQKEEHADRRAILHALREAPREFWRPSPVEREAGRALHAEFDQVLDRLRARLEAWHEANAADRRALIEQARALLVLDDTMRAIDGVKQLQLRWKDAGAVPRDLDQVLWAEFRAVCDAVYNRRDEANAEYAAGLEATKQQVVALCEQAETAAAAADGQRLDASRIAEWRVAFDALGELPRSDARALRDRFDRALAQYEGRIGDQDRRALHAAVDNLYAAARHVRAYERAVEAGAAEREELKAAAEAFIAGVTRWPKGGQQAVRQALARADSAAPGASDRERALRMLCIRAELLSGAPTPADDEGLRREYQVERLIQGMGQGTHADERDWDALLLEWVALRAVDAARHDALERRLQASLARRPKPAAERSPFAKYEGRDGRRDRDDRDPRRDGRGPPRGSPRR